MAESSAPAGHRHWVTLEDPYDRDAYRLGPFPTLTAALEFCDAHNGAQLKAPPAPLDDAFAPTAVGVWSLATCAGYEVGARLRAMLRDPSTIPRDDAATLQARHGARTETDWRLDRVAAATVAPAAPFAGKTFRRCDRCGAHLLAEDPPAEIMFDGVDRDGRRTGGRSRTWTGRCVGCDHQTRREETQRY